LVAIELADLALALIQKLAARLPKIIAKRSKKFCVALTWFS
jgi:hypothetical protein